MSLTSTGLEGTAREHLWVCPQTHKGRLPESGAGDPQRPWLGSWIRAWARRRDAVPTGHSGRQDVQHTLGSPGLLASYLNSAGGPTNRCSVSSSERKVSSHSPCRFFSVP